MAFISVICLKCALYTHTHTLNTHSRTYCPLPYSAHSHYTIRTSLCTPYWSPVSLQDLKLPLPPGWFRRTQDSQSMATGSPCSVAGVGRGSRRLQDQELGRDGTLEETGAQSG